MKRRIMFLLAVLLLTGCARPAAPGAARSASGDQPLPTAGPQAQAPESVPLSGAFVLDGGERELLDARFDVTTPDGNVLVVQNGGYLTVRAADLNKTGDTADPARALTSGCNAAVAVNGGTALIEDPIVTTNALGADAVFVSGTDGRVTLSDGFLVTNRDASAGLSAMRGTSAEISGSDLVTEGTDAPCVRAFGDVAVRSSSLSAAKSPVAVLGGAGSLSAADSTLIGSHILLSADGAEDGDVCRASFENGALTSSSEAPFFQVEQATCALSLQNVQLTFASGELLSMTGGNLQLTASAQQLTGRIVCDEAAVFSLTLSAGSVFTGCLEAELPQSLALTLDADSVWNVTANSYVGALADADATLANIVGNGFTVYYDSGLEANAWLGGRPYALANGGYLAPLI